MRTLKSAKFDELVKRLKHFPEKIVYADIPFKNNDILRLIELTGTKSKSDAIQFAVKYTIERLEDKMNEEKLEKLSYLQKEAHESSNKLHDSVRWKNCQGGYVSEYHKCRGKHYHDLISDMKKKNISKLEEIKYVCKDNTLSKFC